MFGKHPLETKSVPGPGDGGGEELAWSRGENLALKLDGDGFTKPFCGTGIKLFSLFGCVFSVKWK